VGIKRYEAYEPEVAEYPTGDFVKWYDIPEAIREVLEGEILDTGYAPSTITTTGGSTDCNLLMIWYTPKEEAGNDNN
jgi:hypothetical protein